jgi:hypothetical protein
MCGTPSYIDRLKDINQIKMFGNDLENNFQLTKELIIKIKRISDLAIKFN